VTAVNIIRQSSSVLVLTDGAHLEADGRLSCRGNKVFALPHLNAVLAVSGYKFMAMFMADQIGRTELSFDEMKSVIAVKAEAIQASVKAAWEQQFGEGATEFNLYVAGISETSGPDSYLVVSHGDYSSMGVEPWTVVDLGGVSLMPSNEALHGRWAQRISDCLHVEDAISLMNEQRQLTSPRRAGIDAHTVGAFVQLTTIDEHGINSQVIHRWDEDIIGEKIEPLL